MIAAYGFVLWLTWQKHNLNVEVAFSAGQVFTGLAGIGAAVVALAGIAKQFERPAASLQVTAERPIHPQIPGLVDITIFNSGDAPAFGLSVSFFSEPAPSATEDLTIPRTNGWRVGVIGDSGMEVRNATAPLQPSDELPLRMFAAQHLTITGYISWHGGTSIQFTVPALLPHSGK